MKPWALLTLASLVGCEQDAPAEDPVRSARFGILFGGQIQERAEIPLQLDPGRQSQGFRIDLARPYPSDVRVAWEITRPSGAPRGPRRVTELGNGTLRAGQTRFEARIEFEPRDPLGLWNARVVLGDRVVIDRPFEVYDPGRAPPPDAAPTIP